MANAVAIQNDNSRDVDMLVGSSSASYYKDSVAARSLSGVTALVASQRVGTHVDDAGFTVGTDPVVTLAGLADDTSPDSVNEGDSGAVRMSLARALHIVNVADVATLSASSSATSNATLAAANANRIGLLVFNDDVNILFLKYGATASSSSYTVQVPGGGYWEMPSPIYRGIVDGLWDVNGSGSARVTELT